MVDADAVVSFLVLTNDLCGLPKKNRQDCH